jgi:HD superfamily phosphodiesterase
LITLVEKEDTNLTNSNYEQHHVSHNRKKSSFQTDETEKAITPANIPRTSSQLYQRGAKDHSHRVSMMDSEILG